MSDSDFVNLPSPTSSPQFLNVTISVPPRLLDQAQMNDRDELRTITDRILTPIHDFGDPLGGDHPHPETSESTDGADLDAISSPDGGSDQSTLELSSFLPIVQALSSVLHAGIPGSPDDRYYFRGTPLEAEIKGLESLAQRVDAFNLTKSSHQHIPIAMLLSLMRIRRWSGPFFLGLKTLRVTDANVDTMAFLDLFYSPTLRSFELTDFNSWSDSCINDLQNFLHNLPPEAPNISLIKLLLDGSTLNVDIRWLDFVHLRELHLSNVAIAHWQLLHNLSELPSLRIIDLKFAIPQSYSRQFSQENRGEGDWDAIVDSPQRGTPTGFRDLTVLRIGAVIEVLDDLVGMVASNRLQELDMNLLSYSDPPPKETYTPVTPKRLARRRAFIKTKANFTPRNEDSYFFFLLSKLLQRCSTAKCIGLGQSQGFTGLGQLQRDHFIPSTVFDELLQGGIEHLTIRGWKFSFSVPAVIEAVGRNPHLRSLSFPVDFCASDAAAPQGFPLSALSSIAHVFPNLMSFQGYVIRNISGVPDFFPVDSVPKNPHYALRSLSLGDGQLHWDSEDKHYTLRVAFYLDRLFPNLQNIVAGDGKGGDDWRFIERAVKMCQACRASS
ncbi:hypothetical protein D9619_010117 [Psilocybe cf. subviscida]|uniref:Uncharacterized protein n=1 Tax=Psilocybe cf. subviscida TaxID=2480587 RepID=A0A8H5BMQ0_9AGAR|nr:hypothetical protein D9619_010117 [Psilocybe cf. subviscida]